MVYIPITLIGDNLGKRHQYLNSEVEKAYRLGVSFESIENLPEQSAIDRLFKIDLASKYHKVDYIIKNLQDEDILFVSRALKCLWLMDSEYDEIINPSYLENILFPQMITTAANKMIHQIQLHLKDEKRCEQFYCYYTARHFKIAIKFLWRCSKEFILKEVVNILHKITPRILKILCEKCIHVANIFWESLVNSPAHISYYLNNEKKYYNCIKQLLKLDADLILDIIEKYFDPHIISPLSPNATKYVMKYHRYRFNKKPEFYTVYLLDLKTLGKMLSNEEIKKIVLVLAKAEYLSRWFSYKAIEPLLKLLNVEERKLLREEVFVDKMAGEMVKYWPYPIPSSPVMKTKSTSHVFVDMINKPREYSRICIMNKKRPTKRVIKKKVKKTQQRTLLDTLFDQYRFIGFERTLYELRKRMTAESSAQVREYMMLVLVSKSGGHVDNVNKLLSLLTTRHANEPATIRATILRSLCKRAAVWRLPSEPWELLLKYAHGLGLDGTKPEAACVEGFHAVVLRSLIAKEMISKVLTAFLNDFSPLNQYSLSTTERYLVRTSLMNILLESVKESFDTKIVSTRLTQLFNVMDAYHIRYDVCSEILNTIILAIRRDTDNMKHLLYRLFNAHIARRDLFRENFNLVQTDASYVNALRHDANMFASGIYFKMLLDFPYHLKYEQFLRKIALYFNESGGLAEHLLIMLESVAAVEPHKVYARPIALLAGTALQQKMCAVDKEFKHSKQRKFAAELRANAHVARPRPYLDNVEWLKMGAKAVANQVLICSYVKIEQYIEKLLTWKRTVKLALLLALRAGKETQVFEIAASIRPTVTIKIVLKYFCRFNDNIDQIWHVIKPAIIKLDLSMKSRDRLCALLSDTDEIPNTVKIEYYISVYKAFRNFNVTNFKTTPILCKLEPLLPKVNDEFIYGVFEEFTRDYLVLEKLIKDDYYFNNCARLYARIIAKFLLLCTNDSLQQEKIKIVCVPFFDRLAALWKFPNKRYCLKLYINEFLSALKYNRVFFDNMYVSCVPVFEFVIQRLKKILPVEIYFGKYVRIHLTLLYYKAIRQSVLYNPKISTDEPTKLSEGVKTIGNIFGKYIAQELNVLIEKYFLSIRELYANELHLYLLNYFCYNKGKDEFIKSIVRGILESSKDGVLLALRILITRSCNNLNVEEKLKIFKDSDNQEIKFFLNANVY